MRFCQILNSKLSDPKLKNSKIYYYSSTHGHRRANSVTLICVYSMLFLGKSPEAAFAPFRSVSFPPFHDPTPCVCTFKLTILDCLRGMKKAIETGYFDPNTFNIEEYEFYEKVENGDLSWIAKDKFIAFAGPHETHNASPEGYYTLTPDDYIPYFQSRNVGMVVRLNKKYYNEDRFKRAGMKHVDIYYLDGSTPSDAILQRFLDAAESEPRVIAVHCKAGLGRTGSCIGCYAMKHDGWTGREFIGWTRIARPGSVIGPQQQWLCDMEQVMYRAGDLHRKRQARLAGLADPGGGAGLAASMDGLSLDSAAGSGAASTSGRVGSGRRRRVGDSGDASGGSSVRGSARGERKPEASRVARDIYERETAVDASGKSQGDRLRGARSPGSAASPGAASVKSKTKYTSSGYSALNKRY